MILAFATSSSPSSWISKRRGPDVDGRNEAELCFNNQEAGLRALQAVGVFYCSPRSGSEVDHYHVALAAHGCEISGSPRGRCCILLNG